MLYRSSKHHIKRELDKVSPQYRRNKRLELDIADLLIGPTSAQTAQYMAERMCMQPKELALRLREIADRYLLEEF